MTAALNAFRAYESEGFGSVHRFVTIGTGSNIDAIAALDTFPELKDVSMTDIHKEVVKVAQRNLLSVTEKAKDSLRRVAERELRQM